MKVLGNSVKAGEVKKTIGNFEITATISEEANKVELKVKNISMEPRFAGTFEVGEVIPTERLLVNNFQSWGPCKLTNKRDILEHAFGNALITEYPISPVPWELHNHIVSDYFVSTEREFLGFLSSSVCHPYFVMQENGIKIKVYLGKTLKPEESVKLDPLWWSSFPPFEEALRDYAETVAKNNRPRIGEPLFGWASWYHYYLEISESFLEKEIEVIKEKKIQYKLFQVDDGYEKDIGDWLYTNKKFPSGIKSLAEKIRQSNMMPGIWTAPFSMSETSEVFKNHPNWAVKDEEGNPIVAYKNWGKSIYALDTTNPDARRWLNETFSTLRNYGYGFFKIDFLFAGMIPGKRYLNVTPVEAYRMGMSEIRKAVKDAHILGCGAPLLPSIGYVDSMRIGADTAPYWHEKDNGMPSAKYAMRNTLTRNFMNGLWWRNDPDCIMARLTNTELNKNERTLNIFLPALINSVYLQSDKLYTLSEHEICEVKSALNFRGGNSRVWFVDSERFATSSTGAVNGDVLAFVNLSDTEWYVDTSEFTPLLKGNASGFLVTYPSMTKVKERRQKVEPHSILILMHCSRVKLKREDEKKKDGREFHYYGSDET